MSDRKIAEHVGVGHSAVSEWRKSICPIRTDTERTVTRNGTTYQQNTANIGKARTPASPQATEPHLPETVTPVPGASKH